MINIRNKSGKYITELVLFDGGRVYKCPTSAELQDTYKRSNTASTFFPFDKVNGKQYRLTPQFRNAMGDSKEFNFGEVIGIDDLDLCPSITKTVATGRFPSSSEYHGEVDLGFAVESTSELHAIAEYYNLPRPLTEEQERYLDGNTGCFNEFARFDTTTTLLCAIKFINSVPEILKVYLYPKYYKSWGIWMGGESVHQNGTTLERGVSIRTSEVPVAEKFSNPINFGLHTATEVVCSRYLGKDLLYKVSPASLIGLWEGLVVNEDLTVLDTKRFRSLPFGEIITSGRASSSAEEECSIPAPAEVYGWLMKSWFDSTPDLVEYYFPVTSKKQLDSVTDKYGLTRPYAEGDLDAGILPIRASHYELPGTEKELPVTVGSIIFNSDEEAVDILLYKFKRQWEFDDVLDIPDPEEILNKLTTYTGNYIWQQ